VYDWDLLEGMAIGMLMMKKSFSVATDFHSTTMCCCLKALRGFFPFSSLTLSEKKEVKTILFKR